MFKKAVVLMCGLLAAGWFWSCAGTADSRNAEKERGLSVETDFESFGDVEVEVFPQLGQFGKLGIRNRDQGSGLLFVSCAGLLSGDCG